MNIDELKQALTSVADDAADRGGVERLAGVDRKISVRRRTTAAGTALAAVITVTAVAIAPNLLGSNDHTPPADSDNKPAPTSPPTITDKGTSFYTSPAGATLLGHVVAQPGEREVSFRFTPDNLNLSWEQFCWDRGVQPSARGLDYGAFINGHPWLSASCGGGPGEPVAGTSSFGDSPATNAKGWARLGVQVGQPSIVTLRITGHSHRLIAPQLGAAVYTHAPQVRNGGVWYDRQVLYLGHTYQAVAMRSAALSGRLTRVSVDLPASAEKLYVYRGVTELKGALQLGTHGASGTGLPAGSLGGGTGDLVDSDQRSVTVSGSSKDGKSTGTIYVVVYQRV